MCYFKQIYVSIVFSMFAAHYINITVMNSPQTLDTIMNCDNANAICAVIMLKLHTSVIYCMQLTQLDKSIMPTIHFLHYTLEHEVMTAFLI